MEDPFKNNSKLGKVYLWEFKIHFLIITGSQSLFSPYPGHTLILKMVYTNIMLLSAKNYRYRGRTLCPLSPKAFLLFDWFGPGEKRPFRFSSVTDRVNCMRSRR